MTPTVANPLTAFQWHVQPEAESLVRELLESFLAQCPTVAKLAARMRDETGTRFQDWVDHIALPSAPGVTERLAAAGYVPAGGGLYMQEQGIFPRVLVEKRTAMRVGLKVESVADFLAAQNLQAEILGGPLNPLRMALVTPPAMPELWAIERHGEPGFTVQSRSKAQRLASPRWLEAFRTRRRVFDNDADGFTAADRLIDDAMADLGRDWTCDLFFAAEREYWQRRNRAAQVQKARQDRLGLGWANHDHHTYRSSREMFVPLIRVFEKLGFHCRERFYAGGQAGWGAQVLEQPVTGIVIFADVDMSPEELQGDFSHVPMEPRHALGTVGLWCALHGEAFLQAGMHHLECQFDFEGLRGQLAELGINTMKPFTDFPHLRQAFTEGERWSVEPARLEKLVAAGRLTDEQAAKFRAEGALGSHLENLERNQGFKGFNQTGVSEIIAKTDPRRM